MIQVCLLLFIAGLTFGGAGVNWWRETLQKAEESKRVAAEQKLAEETAKAIKEGENKLIDMQAAFEAGQAQAKTIYKTIYAKAQTYVQNTPAYSNPVCVVDAAGVQLINDQIRSMHATAAAAVLGIGVPGSGADQGKPVVDGGSVPAVSGKPATATGVPAEAGKSGGAGEVPGSGVSRPPKPTPIH